VENFAIEHAKAKKNFYSTAYRKELIFLIASLVIQGILILMIIFFMLDYQTKLPGFYSSSSDGQILPLKPLPVANQSNKPLLE
jgi:hypothetical protein